jgi:tetratricopeptide (TPR) repeat protein
MSTTQDNRLAAAEARLQNQRPQTTLEALRQELQTLEVQVNRLQDCSAPRALAILQSLDRVTETIAQLSASNVALGSEATQFETILAQLKRRRRLFVTRAGGAAAFQAARQQHRPAPANWWWFLDEQTQQEQRDTTRRWLRYAVLAVALLAVLGLIYRQFFAPDPTFVAAYGLNQDAENNLIAGNLDQALADATAALEYTPNDPALYVLKGVIEQTLQQEEASRKSFEAALQLLGDRQVDFYVNRAGLYNMAGKFELALADADRALALDPDSANSYLIRAQAYEALGDIPQAIESYELASEAAERIGDSQINVIARVSLGQLLQKPQFPTPEGAETP